MSSPLARGASRFAPGDKVFGQLFILPVGARDIRQHARAPVTGLCCAGIRKPTSRSGALSLHMAADVG
jgi:hypothetical protein